MPNWIISFFSLVEADEDLHTFPCGAVRDRQPSRVPSSKRLQLGQTNKNKYHESVVSWQEMFDGSFDDEESNRERHVVGGHFLVDRWSTFSPGRWKGTSSFDLIEHTGWNEIWRSHDTVTHKKNTRRKTSIKTRLELRISSIEISDFFHMTLMTRGPRWPRKGWKPFSSV